MKCWNFTARVVGLGGVANFRLNYFWNAAIVAWTIATSLLETSTFVTFPFISIRAVVVTIVVVIAFTVSPVPVIVFVPDVLITILYNKAVAASDVF